LDLEAAQFALGLTAKQTTKRFASHWQNAVMTLLSRHMPFAGSEIPVYPDNPRCELSCPGHVFFFSVKLMIIDPDPETN